MGEGLSRAERSLDQLTGQLVEIVENHCLQGSQIGLAKGAVGVTGAASREKRGFY